MCLRPGEEATGTWGGGVPRRRSQVGGGGRPEVAQAGGRDASKLDLALQKVGELIVEQHS